MAETELRPDPKSSNSQNKTSSSESSLSSDSLSKQDPCRKKTRELPNLSDCHGCGLRINYTDPKDRLKTLDSVWRIVLLCKKCIKLANSAQMCTYCFSPIAQFQFFNCQLCKRKIHKDCVAKYRGFAPWSYAKYLNLGSDFSTCLDCWVPELLRNSNRRVYTRRNPNPKLGKGDALRKAVVAKSVDGFVSGGGSSGSDEANGSKAVDDVELAFRLHRAINSSPRILRNSARLDVAKVRDKRDDRARGKIEVPPPTDIPMGVNGKECQQNGVVVFAGVDAEQCDSGDDSRMRFESCEKQDVSGFIENKNRYRLKYSKRHISSKSVSNSENTFLCDSSRSERASESPLPLKCYRRSRFRNDSSRLEKKSLASGLPLKCYKRSRKISKAPFQACAVQIQPYACINGLSRQHPQVNR